MEFKTFEALRLITAKLTNIEKNIERLDEKLDFSIALQRNHLLRVKNNQEISDDMILMGRPYNDLTPEKAISIFHNEDLDFIVVDVSHPDYQLNGAILGSVKIPLEGIDSRSSEIYSKTVPLLVISEKGLRSIQACEKLVKLGFFNVNNVSGGHEFWPGHTKKSTPIKEV